MDDANCDESVYSVDKESIRFEHDYCRAAVTCYTEEKKDHGLREKSTEHAVEKWTDGPSVEARNDDDCNKCSIPAVMGEVLSRASTIFSGLTPNDLSKEREENSAESSHPSEAAERDESSEIKSRSTSSSEYETPSANLRRSAPDDSGMISQESELSESITLDFEFLRDVRTQPRPAARLSPVSPSAACRQTFDPVAMHDSSIHSQPTQIRAGVGELPDFQHAFGSMLPSNFSNLSSPPPELTPHYPSSETREEVFDGGKQSDDSNEPSPPSLTPNYLSSDSERTVDGDISDRNEGEVDLGTQHENSKCGSPQLFSADNYPGSVSRETAITDTSDGGKGVVNLGTQYENSNSNASPLLFSTQDSPTSDNQETAFIDIPDTRVAVIDVGNASDARDGVADIETRYENAKSNDSTLAQSSAGNPELSDVTDLDTRYENANSNDSMLAQSSAGENLELSDVERVIDGNSNGSKFTRSASTELKSKDTQRVIYSIRYENANSNDSMLAQSSAAENLELSDVEPVIDENSNRSKFTRSAPTELESKDTQRVIYSIRYENANSNDSMLAQSTAENPELSDIEPVIDENSNRSKFTRSAPTELESKHTRRVIDRKIRYVTSNCLELTGSTSSITEFLDTRCGVDSDELPTQSCSPFRRDLNENLIAGNKQTPKRKREEEPESLWTDEDYSQSGSPVLEIMSNHLSRLPKVVAELCRISIGTNLSAPGLSINPAHRAEKNPENVAVEIPPVGEFSGSDTSNITNFERRRVRKLGKRKIDFYESKENRPAKKRRIRDETLRRSTFDSKKSPDSGTPRANLNVPRKSDRTGSIEYSEEFLSNRCCEHDHVFPNVSSVDDLLCEPSILKHLVEGNYETIKRKIDILVARIEALGEDL